MTTLKQFKPKLLCENCGDGNPGIFCQLPESDAEELNRHKTVGHFRRRQTLFYEGQVAKGIHHLCSGKVKLYKTDGNGRSFIVRFAQPGDVFGHRALFTGKTYNVTAEMMEEGDVCFIDHVTVYSMLSRNPLLALEFIRRLSNDEIEAENKLLQYSRKTVRERLAEQLLEFQQTSGKPAEGGGVLIDQRLKRDEIAQMLGSSPETISRMLSQFVYEHWVRLDGKKIIVSDIPGLTRAAHLSD